MDRVDAMIDQSKQASAWLADAPRALAVGIEHGRLVLELTSGVVVTLPWSQTHLGTKIPSSAEILGGGLDIYFPDLDEALFVPDLLADIAHLRQAA